MAGLVVVCAEGVVSEELRGLRGLGADGVGLGAAIGVDRRWIVPSGGRQTCGSIGPPRRARVLCFHRGTPPAARRDRGSMQHTASAVAGASAWPGCNPSAKLG